MHKTASAIRAGLCAACLLLTPSAYADDIPARLDEAFEKMEAADTEQGFMLAARDIVLLGKTAIPDLTRRLQAAEETDQQVQITYLLASITGQAKFQQSPLEIPLQLVQRAAQLLEHPADPLLEANLANLAAFIGPAPAELAPGLLSLLQRSDNEGLRATTSAAIGNQGEGVLPFVEKALLESKDDRFSGDLANILRGSQLNPPVVAKLQSLLESDNTQTRQIVARTLEKAEIRDPKLLQAALRDLEDAQTEMDLNRAAAQVQENTDGSEAVAKALQKAFEEKAGRIEERRMIVAALEATGEPGLRAYLDLVKSASDEKILTDITMGIPSALRADPRMADILISKLLKARTDEMVERSTFALVRLDRDVALPAVEQALAGSDLKPAQRKRLYDAVFVSGWKKGAQ